MNDKVLDHLKSAWLTFASAFILEMYTAMEGAATWADLSWKPLLGAAAFVAVRAVLRLAIKR